MPYNLHPIFVHFPIALLFIYSIIKILPLRTWAPRASWRDIERALLIFGVLGAFAALMTGEVAEHLVRPQRDLVEAHSTFAATATWLYVLLLVGEIAGFLNVRLNPEKYKAVLKISNFLERIICYPIVSRIIVIIALTAIFITGLLGGVMVYGLKADPMAGFVLNMLGITYK